MRYVDGVLLMMDFFVAPPSGRHGRQPGTHKFTEAPYLPAPFMAEHSAQIDRMFQSLDMGGVGQIQLQVVYVNFDAIGSREFVVCSSKF